MYFYLKFYFHRNILWWNRNVESRHRPQKNHGVWWTQRHSLKLTSRNCYNKVICVSAINALWFQLYYNFHISNIIEWNIMQSLPKSGNYFFSLSYFPNFHRNIAFTFINSPFLEIKLWILIYKPPFHQFLLLLYLIFKLCGKKQVRCVYIVLLIHNLNSSKH